MRIITYAKIQTGMPKQPKKSFAPPLHRRRRRRRCVCCRMPRVEVSGLEQALKAVADRPKAQNDADYKSAYTMMRDLIAHIASEPAGMDPAFMDEQLMDKLVATKVTLFFVHAPVKHQRDVDAFAELFHNYYQAVGKEGDKSALRAYLMKRCTVVCDAVAEKKLRFYSGASSSIPEDLKRYSNCLDGGAVPAVAPSDASLLSWVGFVFHRMVLQSEHGLSATVSQEWTDELVQKMKDHGWVSPSDEKPLRVLEIGCGRIPFLAKSILQSAETAAVKVEMTCTDSGAAQRPRRAIKMAGVDVILEDALDAVRTRGVEADVLLVSWPYGYLEDFRFVECLYEFSVNRARPSRIIYVGDTYDTGVITVNAFKGMESMFMREFEVESYRSFAGFRDGVSGGYFVPRCQNRTCSKSSISLRRCTRCRKRWYCSEECSGEDWRRSDAPDQAHRVHCIQED